MVSIPKIIGVMTCGVVLCLGLPKVTGAAEEYGLSTGVEDMKSCTDKNVEREVGVEKCREAMARGIHTVKGEVLRVDGDSYLIQGFDGKEVRYRVDSGTEMKGSISRGDRIEAKVRTVNDQTRVLSLRPLQK
jgi:hypothetical protein